MRQRVNTRINSAYQVPWYDLLGPASTCWFVVHAHSSTLFRSEIFPSRSDRVKVVGV